LRAALSTSIRTFDTQAPCPTSAEVGQFHFFSAVTRFLLTKREEIAIINVLVKVLLSCLDCGKHSFVFGKGALDL
jgi:hypothetical protein